MKYYLYILHSQIADKYYTGISNNPYTRLEYHNTIEKGFTSRYRPWKIEFIKEFYSGEDANKAELKVKSWKSKLMLQRVINGEITL